LAGLSTTSDGDELGVRAAVTPVVEALLEPEHLRRQVETLIDGFLPWFTGRSNDFAVHVSLHDSVRSAFLAPEPGTPSLLASAWLELDLGSRMIGGMIESRLQHAEGEPLDEATRAELEELAGTEDDVAGAWFDEQALGAIEEVVPFLLGDTDRFVVSVSFDGHPGLAALFAEQLDSDPETLRADGWRLTDVDLREQMAEDGHDLDERVAIFRPHGRTYALGDLRGWLEEQRAAAADEGADAPPDIEQARKWISRARTGLTWGPALASALLVGGIGFLGGQTWPGRATWSAAALLVASGVALAVTGPLYGATASDALHDWATERRAIVEQSPAPAAGPGFGADVAEHVTTLADRTFAQMRMTARNWLLLAVLTMGGLIGWRVYQRRLESRDDDDRPDVPRTGER
jgi:hypothetical protein